MALPTTLIPDLTALGYFGPGSNEKHSIRRFQRRSLTPLRKKDAGGVSVAPTFKGQVTGAIDQATVDEITVWKQNQYVAPLGLYPFVTAETGGILRSDVAAAWTALSQAISAKGGTIAGPYGDTRRALSTTTNIGASKFSFHIVGRAIDLNQNLGGGKGQRYYLVLDQSSGDTYWQIYCKTDRQDGTQGTKIAKNAVSAYRFGDGQLYKIPEGYFLDLTSEITGGGQFERIKAQSGWTASGPGSRKAEWWHFQWVPDKQETFQDECELVGITEAQLRGAQYQDHDLDHRPG